MKIRRFVGKDMRDALNKVKQELGGDAVIMSNKKIDEGVEIVAACDREPSVKKPTPAVSAPMPEKKPTSLSEIIGDSGPDSLRELLEKQVSRNAVNPFEAIKKPVAAQTKASTPMAAAPAQPVAANQELQDIREELASLRNVLQFQVGGLMEQQRRHKHPLHAYFAEQLGAMGLDKSLADQLVSFLSEQTSEREAWLFLLKMLANRIHTGSDEILSRGGIYAFVGPTGTGKTTTVAKMAARFAQRYGADQVGLITIDSYRIAAYEQLATYAKIIGCGVKKAANAEQLADALVQFRNRRLVLIDTAGFSQRDARLINQLDTLKQSGCATIKPYLLLQANAQREVMQDTLSRYREISMHGCILTKLDECYSLGQALSAVVEAQIPVSFITDGQRVPEDIHLADAKQLVANAARLFKHNAAGRNNGTSSIAV